MNLGATDQPDQTGWYEIRLQGRLDPRWSAWLDGLDITPGQRRHHRRCTAPSWTRQHSTACWPGCATSACP